MRQLTIASAVVYGLCRYADGGHHLPVGSSWTDIWGTSWAKEHEGADGFPRVSPLADLARRLRTYRWPDPDDERLLLRIADGASEWRPEETFLCPDQGMPWPEEHLQAPQDTVDQEGGYPLALQLDTERPGASQVSVDIAVERL